MERPYIISVEDDINDITLMEYVFKETFPDYEMMFFRDGKSAIDHFKSKAFRDQPPQFLLIDVKMLGVTGLEVVKTYREMTDLPQVPIIMLSSSDRVEEIEKAYLWGANSYVEKPRNLDEMRTKLSAIVGYWLHINKL